MATRIYLAGPEVFLPDAREIAQAKKAICRAHGLEGAFPADPEIRDKERLPAPEIARRMAESNLALMDGCNGAIANLTPFRGVSMDTGTAFEMGYMASRGRVVLGYTNVAAPSRTASCATGIGASPQPRSPTPQAAPSRTSALPRT